MDRRLAQDQDRRGIAENLRSQTLKIHTPKWISKWVWNNKRDTFSSKMRPNFWGHVLAQKRGTPDSDGRSRHSRVSPVFRFFRVPNFWAVFWPHFFQGEPLKILIFIYIFRLPETYKWHFRSLCKQKPDAWARTHTHRLYSTYVRSHERLLYGAVKA
jgi:hypothetical protein